MILDLLILVFLSFFITFGIGVLVAIVMVVLITLGVGGYMMITLSEWEQKTIEDEKLLKKTIQARC